MTTETVSQMTKKLGEIRIDLSNVAGYRHCDSDKGYYKAA